MKKFWKRIGIFTIIFVATVTALRYSISIIYTSINFKSNQKLLPVNSIIYNQSNYEEYKFGFGNIRENGCGVVAVYNILKIEGKNPNFTQIIKDCEPFGTNLFGIWGTNPQWIKRYLKKQGLDVQVCFDMNKFHERAQNARYAIYTYLSFKGGHYQLLTDFCDGKYQSINPYQSVSISELNEETKDYFIHFLILVN